MLTKIFIQNGAFKKIPAKVKGFGAEFTIITDKNLKNLGEELLTNMRKAGLRSNLLVIASGEQTKSLSLISKLATSLLGLGMKRDSCLIALGGGVIGDITGFLASIYMRGIPYIVVPTTLLSMGDSSIGGKTGVDVPEGKNLLGTFYQAKMVITDPLLLKTLPQRDFHNGLAEIVKHAVIANRKFFKKLSKNVAGILKRKPQLLQKIVQESVTIKMNIVKKDEREEIHKVVRSKVARSRRSRPTATRMLLNYGHTVGHALEKLSNYTLPHGEAVAIGMVAENRLAVGKNLLKVHEAKRIAALLKAFHLPTKIPSQYSLLMLKKAMSSDKKIVGGKMYFPLPVRIGKARIVAI